MVDHRRDGSLEASAFRVEPESIAEGRSLGSLGVTGGTQQCLLLIRNHQRLPPEPDTVLQVNDEIWLLLQSDEIDSVAPFFTRAQRRGALASHNFFGEFIIDAESPAADLALLYGLSLSESERSGSIAQMMLKRLGKQLVVGDRLSFGAVRLTVRSMKGTHVTSVGLKILAG